MIAFLLGLAAGLAVAWFAVRRRDALHRDVLIAIHKGYCEPDYMGHVGWFPRPQPTIYAGGYAAAAADHKRTVEKLKRRSR